MSKGRSHEGSQEKHFALRYLLHSRYFDDWRNSWKGSSENIAVEWRLQIYVHLWESLLAFFFCYGVIVCAERKQETECNESLYKFETSWLLIFFSLESRHTMSRRLYLYRNPWKVTEYDKRRRKKAKGYSGRNVGNIATKMNIAESNA